jgi:hypothetical protein
LNIFRRSFLIAVGVTAMLVTAGVASGTTPSTVSQITPTLAASPSSGHLDAGGQLGPRIGSVSDSNMQIAQGGAAAPGVSALPPPSPGVRMRWSHQAYPQTLLTASSSLQSGTAEVGLENPSQARAIAGSYSVKVIHEDPSLHAITVEGSLSALTLIRGFATRSRQHVSIICTNERIRLRIWLMLRPGNRTSGTLVPCTSTRH